MSLKTEPNIWADSLLKLYTNYKRQNTEQEMSKNGFNIKEEAQKLTNKYFDIMKERN